MFGFIKKYKLDKKEKFELDKILLATQILSDPQYFNKFVTVFKPFHKNLMNLNFENCKYQGQIENLQNISQQIYLKGYYGLIYQQDEIQRLLANLKSYAKLVLQVPIFDEEISTLVKRKFESDENIVKFLQDQLSQSVKPILAKKRELEARFDKEMQQLLHSNLE